MVLMNGTKNARNVSSVINRGNTCGGVKKAGLAPRTGIYMASNILSIRASQTIPMKCVPNTTRSVSSIGMIV